jgi:hypothetical protein
MYWMKFEPMNPHPPVIKIVFFTFVFASLKMMCSFKPFHIPVFSPACQSLFEESENEGPQSAGAAFIPGIINFAQYYRRHLVCHPEGNEGSAF